MRFAKERGLFDTVADALRSAFEYDKTYFDKLTASLLPLLEKLTSGTSGRLLAPLYADLNDQRPILDWMRVIRENAIVYVGLDSLSDREVSSAVGNSMFADLTSVAGALYKFGDTRGLPSVDGHRRRAVTVHADEFNEIVGDEFIPLLNKGGGAGLQITAYTQTASDIEAGIGDRAKAGQVTGNLNSLIMLRIKNEETAEFLTQQLPPVRIYRRVAESRVTDDNHPQSPTDFISQNADRITDEEADMLRPADLIELPKGQAFALLDGGKLYKLRLPLAGADPLLPIDMAEIVAGRKRSTESAAMAERRTSFEWPWFVKWGLAVMLATLVVDCLYVTWPYPHGAIGLDRFCDNLSQEESMLIHLAGHRYQEASKAIDDGLYTILFRCPGFDSMIARAKDPTPLDSGGELMRKGVLATHTFWETATTGLQLFSARLAMVWLSLPMITLVAIAGLSDGLLIWNLRRTGAGRESGFVYHRAKRYAGQACLALGFGYLAPPIIVDPRPPITLFAVMIFITLRIASATFKKFI